MIKTNVIVNNISWNKYLKNPSSFVDKAILSINKKNRLFKKKIFIFTLLLTDTTEIKKLNKKFRKKNKSTDVLSFPFYERKELKSKIRNNKEIYLGDIIINLNKIKNKNNKLKFNEALNKLWVHGLVHLFGYKHKKNKDFIDMSKIEKKYLKYIS